MGLYSCNNRRRPSIPLDAGYVIYQSSQIIGLHGKKLICVICVVLSLFLISLINLSCLIWVMHKLDWSLFNKNGSQIFRINKINQQVEFAKQIISNKSIYTTQILNKNQINISGNKYIDIYGNQNSILFDDNKILLIIDKFNFKNQTLIDFTDLKSLLFDSRIKTRIHLEHINSQHIHNKRLNISANNHLTIANVNRIFSYSQYLQLEANRHNHQSLLRFKNYPQNLSLNGIHFNSDLIYFNIPRLPLLHNNYHSDSNISRLCICQTTFLVLKHFANQSCPSC